MCLTFLDICTALCVTKGECNGGALVVGERRGIERGALSILAIYIGTVTLHGRAS